MTRTFTAWSMYALARANWEFAVRNDLHRRKAFVESGHAGPYTHSEEYWLAWRHVVASDQRWLSAYRAET